ncbi:MAG: hypothetical protein LBH25_07955 [Fibromonadaceae bacterium]|jgi:hypothetical protein|nr:hypothetical protein [Fibromonadaceae bacterium]
MKNKATIYVLILISLSQADFIGLDIVEKEEPSPTFVYGANYAGRIFAGGIDNFGGVNAHYRISKNFAAGAKGEFDFSRAGLLAGGFFHYLPSGNLHKELAENFVHLGIDYIKINSKESPVFSAGYGRDMLPWKKSSFGFRAVCRIEYALARHTFARSGKGIFGLDMTKLANTGFALEFGMFLY